MALRVLIYGVVYLVGGVRQRPGSSLSSRGSRSSAVLNEDAPAFVAPTRLFEQSAPERSSFPLNSRAKSKKPAAGKKRGGGPDELRDQFSSRIGL